jgi:predicted ATPase/class 3 adenylate cyclase
MTTRNETFGRLLKGAINSIAAYEGTTAPAIEDDLGQQIGLAGSALQRYKAGHIPPDPRTIEIIASAAVRRAYLGRPWLQVFLHAARYPQPEALLARLLGETTLPVPASTPLPTGTVTFLFTDIVGSTQRWETQAPAMQRALARHDAILRQAITAQSGVVFKTVGDAFCAAFATAPAAVQAALTIQRLVLSEPWAVSGLTQPLLVRTVLHTGAAEQRDGDYFGPPLNRVARLCGVGHGGQILLSLATQDLARDQLPAGTSLRDLGEHRLKDLARPERIFHLLAPDLPAAFPPLNTLDRARHNLPAQPTALIGREAEVEAVCELVRDPATRLLTLTGPGGTGKTRLALQVAGELVDQFADGAWFVALAPIRDPALVASAIGTALGLREQGSRPMHEMLHEYLREKELLLVLDNFEQVTAAAPLVGGLLATAAHLTIVVTSRVVLHLYGEREYAVPPLRLPERIPPPTVARLTQYEAVRLFIERARAVRADFAITIENAPLIAEICHRLDGLPLAIELAAARSKLFAPQAILHRLDRRLATLTGGARDLPARQQTLRGAIDWSYNLLDAGEQEAFARLGVFVGGCTMEAAEAVLLAGGELLIEPLDILRSLVDKSLLTQSESTNGEPRFGMLETIREYALERLAAGGMEAIARQAHAAHFVAFAEAGAAGLRTPDELAWLDRFTSEHDNLRAALTFVATEETAGAEVRVTHSSMAEQLARLCYALDTFWYWRGHWREGHEWLGRCVERAEQLTDQWRANVYFSAANMALVLSDYATAMALLNESLALYKQLNDRGGIADALMGLGHVGYGQSDYTTSLERFQVSLALARELGDPYRQLQALAPLSFQFYILGEQQEALQAAEEAIMISQSLGLQTWQSEMHITSGMLLLSQGALHQATERLTTGQQLCVTTGNRHGISSTLNYLGQIAMKKGDYHRAIALYSESLSIRREVGDRRGSTAMYGNLSHAYTLTSDYLLARMYAAEGLRLSTDLGYQQGQVWGLVAIANALIDEHPVAALHLMGAAERLREEKQIPIWKDEQAEYDRVEALARAALSDEAYAAAWATGRALRSEEAIAEALGWAQNHGITEGRESHGNGSVEDAETP